MSERVLIADDHRTTRALVRQGLEGEGFEVCWEAEDATGAVEGAFEMRPDVCLLDIDMPGSGLAATRIICGRLPDTAVVMLTISREADHLLDAFRAGASGYVLKGDDPCSVARALRAVLAGEVAVPRQLTADLVEGFRQSRNRRVTVAPGQQVRLSEREWEVLTMLRDGLSTTEIAERTYVSPVTVRSHISSLLRKLRVSSRDEAVLLVFG